MVADIACADCSIKRVRKRVQPRIGIGMALELLVMGNSHAAKRDVIAILEGVHVKPCPGSHIGEWGAGSARRNQVRHRQVLRCRDLHILGRVFDKRHVKPAPFGDGCVVREIRAAGCSPMGVTDFRVVKGLRRLCAP